MKVTGGSNDPPGHLISCTCLIGWPNAHSLCNKIGSGIRCAWIARPINNNFQMVAYMRDASLLGGQMIFYVRSEL